MGGSASNAGRTVQATSMDDVLAMYERYGLPAFAIWIQKEMFFPFEGADMEEGCALLAEILEQLRQSAAIYTLRVYKTVPVNGIVNTTPYTAGFNFKLKDIRGADGEYLERRSDNSELMGVVNAMRLELQEMRLRLDGEEEEQPENDVIGRIQQVLAHPLTNHILGYLNLAPANATEPVKRAVMNGVNAPTANDQDLKIQQAVAVLKEADPQCGDHLLKLAAIAQSDPKGFKMLLGYLDGM
jgi:hypothetical protein